MYRKHFTILFCVLSLLSTCLIFDIKSIKNVFLDTFSSSNYHIRKQRSPSDVNSQSTSIKNVIESKSYNFSRSDVERNYGPCSYEHLNVNCSGLSITDIQPSWFPNETQNIFLNKNSIRKLTNGTFSHLFDLISLDLSDNDIDQIQIRAFEGLHNLKSLNLFNNRLRIDNFNDFQQIFKPLSHLEELNIIQDYHYNVRIYSFQFLEHLVTLQELSTGFDLDILYFGTPFRNITNLTCLRISGNIKYITDTSFINVPEVTELYLEFLPYLTNISHKAFFPLAKLHVFRMFYLIISAQYVFSLFQPFEGRNMTEINLDTVSSIHTLSDPKTEGYVTYNDVKHLVNICLKTLKIINCRIYYLTLDTFQTSEVWDKCLVNVYISHNVLLGSISALFRLMKLKSLESLTIFNVNRPCSRFSDFPQSISKYFITEMPKQASSSMYMQDIKKKSTDMQEIHFVSFYDENPLIGFSAACTNLTTEIVTFSESIRYISLGGLFTSQIMECHFQFHGAQNVEYLDISESGFGNFTGTTHGFMSLKTFLLSGNDVSRLNKSYLDSFPALENLACSHCSIDRDLVSLHSGRLFQNVTRLRQLDLSYNLLNFLSKDTFKYNRHLKWLSLSGNQFKEIPFSLKYTQVLQWLDLRQNSLNTIDMLSAHELDQIVSRTGNLEVLLDGNILSCGCNNIQFLQWMRLTLVTFDLKGNFTCLNDKGERTYTLDYHDMDSLWRECYGPFFLYMALIIWCFYLIGIFVSFIMIKNKKFIIFYFSQLLGNFKVRTRNDYPIGVYIGYSDTDYNFACHDIRRFIEQSLKLKTFLIDRDLIVSLDKASGIIDALNASWRILLVCSESFLKEDDWSMFTMRSAIYAQSPVNPARVVVLVHKDCLPIIPSVLVGSVNDENILVVSEWSMNYEMTQMLTTRLT